MSYKNILKIISVVLICFLFVDSGLNKILNFSSTVDGLQSKLQINNTISQVLIILAILFVLGGSFLMIFSLNLNNNLLLKLGSIMLIIFTILATLIYHPITDPSQKTNFLKNIAIIGGLTALLIQGN
jgi:uncharacterized membrane protein YphA (DoxX/SURF4 family)